MINMSGSIYSYPVSEKVMDEFSFGGVMFQEQRISDWLLEDLGCHPYRSKQPNGYSDLSKDWMSTELIIRRLMYAKKAFHKLKVNDMIDDKLHEKIVHKNLDNPDQILKILSKSRSNEEKHIVLFNLPEVLKA